MQQLGQEGAAVGVAPLQVVDEEDQGAPAPEAHDEFEIGRAHV